MQLGRRGLILIGVAGVLVVAIAALFILRATIAQAIGARLLASRGVEAAFHLAQLDFNRAVIETVRLGPEDAPSLVADRIEARYAPFALIRGQVRYIGVEGLEIRVGLNENGLSMSGLPASSGGGRGGFGAGRPPAVAIEGARLIVETSAGPLVADIDLTGGPEEGWRGLAQMSATEIARGPDAIELEQARVEMTVADGVLMIDGRADLTQIRGEGVRAEDVAAAFSLEGQYADASDLQGLDAEGALNVSIESVMLSEEAADLLAGHAALARVFGALTAPEREMIAAALARGSVQADFDVRAREGELVFAPAPALIYQAASGAEARLGATSGPASGAGGALTFAPASGRIMARNLSLVFGAGMTADGGAGVAFSAGAADVRPREGFAVALENVRAELRRPGGAATAAFAALEAVLPSETRREAVIDIDGLALTAPQLLGQITDADVAIELDLDGTGAIAGGRASIANARYHDTNELSRFVDANLSGAATIEAGVATGDLDAVDLEGRALAHADVRHDLSRGAGEIAFATPDFEFTTRGRQPTDVIPVLRGYVVDATGDARASGAVRWSASGLTGDAELNIEELAFDTRFGRIEGLSTTFRLADLLSLTTDAPQQVRVGLLDAGLALEDGVLLLGLFEGRSIDVVSGRFPLAGGALRVEPTTIEFGAPDQSAVLLVEDVDLSRLVALMRPPNINVTGAVSGRIPLVARERGVEIVGGELVSEGAGEFSYTGGSSEDVGVDQESVNLAFDALKNFQYDQLRVTLNGDVAGLLDIGVHFEGRNPDVYDGYPIDFNLNLSAEILSLMATQFFRGVSLDAIEAARRAVAARQGSNEAEP